MGKRLGGRESVSEATRVEKTVKDYGSKVERLAFGRSRRRIGMVRTVDWRIERLQYGV